MIDFIKYGIKLCILTMCLGLIAESHTRLPQSTSLILHLMASQADLLEEKAIVGKAPYQSMKVSSPWNCTTRHSFA